MKVLVSGASGRIGNVLVRELIKSGYGVKALIKPGDAAQAIRALDSGSDNSAEIELNNLSNPYYDIERFGISFVASPRHADILIVTGAVSQNMAVAVRKTFDAMPSPKLVIALGDDACGNGIVCGGYGVLGGVDKILPVDLKIPGNPPEPIQIITALLGLMRSLGKK